MNKIDPLAYEKIPKSVLAAIAVSLISNGGDDLETRNVTAAILNEWEILFDNGIVPQKPVKL